MAHSGAGSCGMFLFVDDNCTEKEIKNVVRRLKRKLDNFHVTDTNSTISESSADGPPKSKQNFKNKVKTGMTKYAKFRTNNDDNSMESESGRDEEQQIVERSRTNRKLRSRLSRILKKKSNREERTKLSTIESYDTESCLSVDSGIQCENCCEMNLEAAEVLRDKSNIVAMDCEFVGVGPQSRNALGRCSIIDYNGNVICDVYAKPEDPITDYRTPWSGLRKRDMVHAVPFDTAQNTIKRMLQGKIVVGHSIHNDFRVLQIKHPRSSIRDTAKCNLIRNLAGLKGSNRNGLKNLARILLGRKIQVREHCSIEDSKATLDLYKLVEDQWESDLKNNPKRKNDSKNESPHNSGVCDDYLNDEYWPDEL